jgi:high-affinity Fe2+/Pb2+ permease
MEEQDPLVGELQRERRDRQPLVVAAVVGIIAGVVLGMAFTLGGLGEAAQSTRSFGSHGALVFFIGPPAISMALGYAMFSRRRRR